jgi:hypothetical protein
VPYRGRVRVFCLGHVPVPRYLFEDCLFSLPEKVASDVGDVVINHPKCKAPVTRSAAFRLLAALCRDNLYAARRFQELLAMMVHCVCARAASPVFTCTHTCTHARSLPPFPA